MLHPLDPAQPTPPVAYCVPWVITRRDRTESVGASTRSPARRAASAISMSYVIISSIPSDSATAR